MADTKSQEKAINEHDTNDEVLFRENPNRFVVFPIAIGSLPPPARIPILDI